MRQHPVWLAQHLGLFGITLWIARCYGCEWHATFMDRTDAERHAQRHRALTAQEEAGQ